MIAPVVGAVIGGLGGVAAEPLVRRLPAGIEDAAAQRDWTVRIRRPPVMELVGLVLGLACGLRIGWTGSLVVALAMIVLLVPITFIDLSHRVIPNKLVLPGTVVALVLVAVVEPDALPAHAISAAAAFVGFLLLALIYPAGMGLGDVKLALMLGAFLGPSVFVATLVSFVASAVPSLVIVALRGRSGVKVAIPFGPFLAFGGVVAVLWGPAIAHWYLHRH